MSRVAIIPARGGSKRIPHKNIRLFDGVPIIAHSIRAALDSALFDRVVVSTDSEEIAAVAREYGAQTPFMRPADLSNDHAGTLEVVQHALRALGESYGYACCIYATAPFIDVRYLREGIAMLEQHREKSYAFSVTTFAFPVQRALRLTADGGLDAVYPEHRLTRSQDLPETWHDAGQFYWGRAEAWQRGDTLFSPLSMPVVLPRHLVQDIDTPEDWRRAELMFAALRGLAQSNG
ncbi:pseudaminic acid cytidylyltransferase [Paraburkholderia phymatum]|uniref:Acylneuraminate cytidylyltransferase n=1 Tax=Paraburkholderia phymatum (strain DSM 17167 / CIP 108236 / LMG 21445 / STM815) TaxID=391038 RepID=B2JJ77_PARP8|nr:pseudaminic acid cytidylyltransferase [Paraburkholderia phymatum]ACC72179.1 acylneuraminate cytidylyltransferase [Paraburkholderia phymatum STM815]